MPDVFDQVHAQKAAGGDLFDQVHAEQQKAAPPPSAVSRLWNSFVDTVNPIPAFQEWLHRGEERKKMFEGLHVALNSAGREMTPEEAAVIDTAMTAKVGMPGQSGYTPPVGTEPALKAGNQVASGDLAGATGTILGGYGVPAAVAKTLQTARGAVSGSNAAAGLRASAEQNYATALNPTTKINKALVEKKIAPGLVERGVQASSIEDLRAQAQAQMEHYGSKIEDAFDAAKTRDIRLDWEPLYRKLEAAKLEATVDGVIPEASKAYISKLSGLQDELLKIADKNGGTIPAASARSLRQLNDSVVAKSKGGFALSPDDLSTVEAHKIHADALRSSIAELIPEAADANKEYSFWRNVDKVAGETSTRRVGQKTPLTERMLQGAGAAVGAKIAGPGGAMAGATIGGKLARLQNSMAWNSVSATTKAKVASLIESGDTAAAWDLANKAALAAAGIRQTRQIEAPAQPEFQ